MAKNNKADMSCARVKKYTASDVSKAERHNERKNETYSGCACPSVLHGQAHAVKQYAVEQLCIG